VKSGESEAADSAPVPSRAEGPTLPVADEPEPVSLYGAQLGVGALVGPYVIQEIVSRGGVANLYRGCHEETGVTAAIKVIHSQFAGASKVLRRFQQEADSLRKLRHPNIVEIWGSGELRDGRPYIAMEWLEGRDLGVELAERGAYSVDEALSALTQIAAGLSAAHALGIAHRDLKAQNVMVLHQGEQAVFKLVDFGIAKLLASEGEPGSGLTSTGVVLGTPIAMAPEQIRGEAPDQRTDVYALGVLLYQLLTGQVPFRGATALEIEEMHLHAAALRPSLIAAVPAALDAAVMRCLEKNPENRFQSVDALLSFVQQPTGEARRAASSAQALGLFVQARIASSVEQPPIALLEQVDLALAEARESLRATGLRVALETGSGFLAVVWLSVGKEERELRRRVLRQALDLIEKISGRVPDSVAVSIGATVARAESRSTTGGGRELLSGELLALTQWAGHASAVTATSAALAGLERDFCLRPIRDRRDLFQLLPAR